MVERSSPKPSNDNAKLTPTPSPFNGPWMKADLLARIPNLARAFQMSRDPHIAAQVRDLDKTERERREESDGKGARMVKQDKPHPAPKPSPELARKVDAASFNGRWLAAQYEAARATARPIGSTHHSPDRTAPPRNRGPQR